MAKGDSLVQDISGAVNHALSPVKIVVMTLGTLIALIALVGLGELGALIKVRGLQWLTWIIQAAGILGAVIVIVSNMVAVIKMVAQEESGGKKMSFLGGIGVAISGFTQVLFAIMKPLTFILIGYAVIFGVGVVCLIPAVGPIIWGVGGGLIAVLGGIFAAFWMLKLLLAVFVLPTVIAEGKKEDAGYYKTSADFVKGHIFPLLVRLAIVAVMAVLFLQIFFTGLRLAESTAPITMGKNAPTINAGPLKKFVPGDMGLRFHPSVYAQGLSIRSYQTAGERMRGGYPEGVHKVGGIIYSIGLGVLSCVALAVVFIFTAVSGRKAYEALKDQPVVEIKGPDVDVDAVRKKVKAIHSKVKEEMGDGGDEPAKKEEAGKEKKEEGE